MAFSRPNSTGTGVSGAAGEVEAAVQNKPKNFSYGADILDVGGESTRPGSQPVNTEEELGRVIPVIEAIAVNSPMPSFPLIRIKP